MLSCCHIPDCQHIKEELSPFLSRQLEPSHLHSVNWVCHSERDQEEAHHMVYKQGTAYLNKRSHRKSGTKIPAPSHSAKSFTWHSRAPYGKTVLPVCGRDEVSSTLSWYLSAVSSILLALTTVLSISTATELWVTWSHRVRF